MRRRKGRGETEPEVEEERKTSKKSVTSSTAGRSNEVGKIYVMYVDDSAVISNGEGRDRTEEVRQMVDEEGCDDVEFVPLKFEDIYRTSTNTSTGVAWKLSDADTQHISSTPSSVTNPTEAIQALFSSLHPTNTPRTGASSARTRIEDLHRLLIHTLLRRTATQYDCSSLLFGDTATRISIRLIEDLAKGAGHKLAVQGSDAVWIDDLLIVRPFKTHLLQEVLFYTQALGLEGLKDEQSVVPPQVSVADIVGNGNASVPVMDKTSIARLTETFILNLEKGVPSTVTTIGKTGGKLVLNAPITNGAEDTAVEAVSNSTTAFQQVGPSVSLRSRTNLPPKSDASEPRIGSRGIKLAQLSESAFHWNTRSGCALCEMPSQHPTARHWKRNVTISSLGETAKTGGLVLSDHLCYACLLVLAPPVTAGEEQEGTGSMLPSYVLHHIRRKSERVEDEVDGVDVNGLSLRGDDDDEGEEGKKGEHGKCASDNPAPQPMERSQIKAQINEFLLDDA